MNFDTNSKVVPSNTSEVVSYDPEELANISSTVQTASEDIASVIEKIQSLSAETQDGVWTGESADLYREKAAEIVTTLTNLNQEINTDAAWVGSAGQAAADLDAENTQLMGNL